MLNIFLQIKNLFKSPTNPTNLHKIIVSKNLFLGVCFEGVCFGGRLQNAPTQHTLKVIDYKSVCSTYPAIAGFPTQHTIKVIDYQSNQLFQSLKLWQSVATFHFSLLFVLLLDLWQ